MRQGAVAVDESASRTDSVRRINGPEFRLTASADYSAPLRPSKIAPRPTTALCEMLRLALSDVKIAPRPFR